MIARYPLRQYIVSFDFFHWLAQVKARGATEVVFDTRRAKTHKWDLATTLRRYRSICRDGVALAGLPWREGEDGEDVTDPHMVQLVRFLKAGGRIAPLTSVLPPAAGVDYTVTLRRTQRDAHRNSEIDLWLAFADEIGAEVVHDYDTVPRPLHERMALYAGAKMNYFVANGPGFLCTMTPYPVAMFGMDQVAGVLAGNEIPQPCAALPWQFGVQHLIYEAATASNLRAFHERIA